jgi:large subunit ribosomal protein L2
MWLNSKRLCNKLSKKKPKACGRNSTGKITVRHRGGSKKNPKLINLDFTRFLWHMPAVIRSLERSASYNFYVACLFYSCGVVSYINAPAGLKPGHVVEAGDYINIKVGNATFIKNIPLNKKIHNIEIFPKSGAKFARAAGTFGKVLEQHDNYCLVLVPGGKKIKLSPFCFATIGRVSNILHHSKNFYKKAGDSRINNIRPKVRGVAMNAVDHPHGGGKGKKSPKNPNYNFVRKLVKGRKTA